jgi:hypothetical protein
MKKIAPLTFLFSFAPATTKFDACKAIYPLRKQLLFSTSFILLLLQFTLQQNSAYGQQVIGSFPVMEGGFENAGTDTVINSTAVAAGVQLTKWRGAYSTSSSFAAIYNSNVRTGTKSLQWTTGGSGRLLFSKTAASTAIANSTSYVVQFYWWKAHSASVRSFDVSVSTSGSVSGAVGTAVNTGSLGVSAPSIEWTKHTMVVTSGTNAVSPRYGLARFSMSGGSVPSPGYLFDDFCIYPGTEVDNTAPGDATSPEVTGYTNNSLDLSWTAPGGGVDGGGYVVIRYAADPTSEPSPNTNGIYAVGNSIGTGTVVYIGTNTSFTDVGLTANSAYYYKVYVADKAFNYSPNPTTFSGFTGIAGQTAVTITTPSSCNTGEFSITWTGPLNYAAANYTQLAFLKAGSAVTTGTPAADPTGYTASTSFGSGTAYEHDANAWCVYNGDGTDGSGNHSGLTITGLSPNTTYHLLVYNIQDAGPTYAPATTGNATTLNSLGEPANSAGAFAKGTVTTSGIGLSWTAAGGSPAPTGYLIQASSAAAPFEPSDFTDMADQTDITGGTANAKTTGTAYTGFTGFSAGTMYYFRNNTYTNSNACINYKVPGVTIQVATLPNAVTAPVLDITGGTGTINWVPANGYNNSTNTTLVFVSSSPITLNTPTSNPAAYTANTAFGAGTPYQWHAGAACVYSGDGTGATVTGLVAGNTYYVLILTVVNTANYDATYSYSAYATTSAVYNPTGEYTWNGGGLNDWQVAANWTPTRTTPGATDVLIFNTPGTVTVTNVPTQTIAKLAVNAGDVSLQSAGPATLTVADNNGLAINDVTIAVGTALSLSTQVNITLGTNSSTNIAGTLNVNSGCTYNTNGTGVVTTVAGTLNNYGTVTSTTATKLVVNNGGTYNHGINGGTLPRATWNFNSTCLISGITTADEFSGGSHAQTFSNFVWDCPSQNSDAGGSPDKRFVMGAGINSGGPYMVVTDTMIIKRTNGIILQLSSSGGQRDFTVGNYYQYGGIFAITYDTEASGEQRSLTVNKTFYVTDSLEANTRFQIINTPDGENIIGRLFVGGEVEMHPTLSASILERVIGGAAARAELWFTGSTPQTARFHTFVGDIDFVTNHTGSGVTLLSDATANFFKLVRGTFFISSNTLTINNAVSYPAPGTGAIGGSSASNLVMGLNGNAGTLNFANGSRLLKDFTQLAGNSLSLGTELAITAGATPGRDSLGIGAVLNTNDNLVLRSDAAGTARMAQLPVNGSGVALATINGKVTVERHLPMTISSDARRWRLLTAPFKTTNSPTINEAWQEGASNPDRLNPSAYDPRPGYGTHITRSTVFGSDGYDQGSTNNPSIYYYSGTGWAAPANTNSVKITDNSGAYMLFARGDRSIVVSTTTINAGPTTLAPRGELNTGNVTIPLTASGHQTVGNPYASQIKLDNISFNDTLGNRKTIYLWDPKTLGSFNVGKFITCSGDGNLPATYTYTGNTSPYENGYIESSGAFMVKGNGGNIVFHESDKTISSSTTGIASRPTPVRHAAAFGTISKLHTDLLVMRAGVFVLADGVANTYNKNYKNAVDDMDAPKLSSFTSTEQLSIRTEGQLFAIERRKKLEKKDTIFLNISRLNPTDYEFGFRPMDFDDTYTALLVDNYQRTTTPFRLTQHTNIPFKITADPASAAADRFYIIFRKSKPAKDLRLKAAIRDRDIVLEWNGSLEENGPVAFMERSATGEDFETVSENIAGTGNVWLDRDPAPGAYFYRIRYEDREEETQFSNTVKLVKAAAPACVYPNPVQNGRIGLQLPGLPQGTYQVRLLNGNSQVLYSGSINWVSNSGAQVIDVSKLNVRGICRLEVRTDHELVATVTVLLQ